MKQKDTTVFYLGGADMHYKDERLALKVLPAHKIALKRLADAEGEAMAVVVRRLIKNAASQRGFWPAEQPRSNQEATGQAWETDS